ncbi:SsgA family sporulation/cell division regulator [Amycolatopsis thermoflava]|uniref:SsgA family sporulation/cell division regulator n=1 Tax=Amycolatopsis thermoflava TaxID=84480 RepID=UPI003F49E79D
MLPTSLNLPMWAELEDRSGEVIELVPVKVKFRYRTDDPFAVVLDFAVGAEQWVRWHIARDLLAEGLALPPRTPTSVGEGDVAVAGDLDVPWRVWISLSSPTGVADFAFKRASLVDALAKTEALVPIGTESDRIDWNREFAALGGEAA